MSKFLENMLNKAKIGDREAINELCTRYQPYIRTVLKSTGYLNEADIDDVLQDCLILVATKIGCLKENRAFISWLGSLAYRQAVGFLRKKKRYGQLPENYTVAKEEKTAVIELHNAIAELSEADQKLIKAYYWDGHSYEDLAFMFDKTVDQMRRKIYAVNARLREIML